ESDKPDPAPARPAGESRTTKREGDATHDLDGTPPVPPPEVPGAPAVPGYAILGELGRGGMGVVYQARQLALNRLVALQMIRTGEHATADELARFRVEAEAVARLQH